jgi:hypothetical protein
MIFEHLISHLLNHLLPPREAPVAAGVVLGRAVAAPHSTVVWPDRHRREHAVAIGKTGAGKTYALERIAVDLAKRPEGFAFFDFHGDASLTLIQRLLSLPFARQRIVVLDPSHPTLSASINVLASDATDADRFRRVSELSSILRQRWGMDSFGARTEELLRNSLYTLAVGGQTLAELPRLLTEAPLRRALTDRIEHPDVAAYWRDRYEPLSEPMKAAFREPLLNKVTAFLAEPGARHLLGQPVTSVDIPDLIERGAWLIIRLPKGELREHAHTLGNLLFAQLQFAAMARGRRAAAARTTFTLICDEAQNLAENVNDLTAMLAEGRKFGISVITANQFWEQLPRDLRGALLSAATLICFRVSAADAQVLANELGTDQRQRHIGLLTELSRGEAVARFGSAASVRFKVAPLPHVDAVSERQLDDLIAVTARPRAEIEASLRRSGRLMSEPLGLRQDSAGSMEVLNGW